MKTPFYYYDLRLLEDTLLSLNNAVSGSPFRVHYAIKANAENKVLEVIKKHGLGADCVSGNEMIKASEIGFDHQDIVLAGVGKTDDELEYAITQNIHSINCESIEELEVINQIAKDNNMIANIAFRLNPNIDAYTHRHITTGLSENKFGIPATDLGLALEELSKYDHLHLKGIHFHIGSQILSLNPYAKLCLQANEIQTYLADQGINIDHLNMGGGLGINYQDPDNHLVPNFSEYFGVFRKFLQLRENQSVHFELGRSIVGQMGSLISKVLYVKKGQESNFAIVDAGMTDLIRPALYNSYHDIENMSSQEPSEAYRVVGPICETTDSFGDMELPRTQRGDILRIKSAGAYGQVLGSNYNLRDNTRAVYSTDITLEEAISTAAGTSAARRRNNGEVTKLAPVIA